MMNRFMVKLRVCVVAPRRLVISKFSPILATKIFLLDHFGYDFEIVYFARIAQSEYFWLSSSEGMMTGHAR